MKTTISFLTVSFGLFLCFSPVECQWGFGLGNGGGWKWLWSNMEALDKYDLNNKDISSTALPKQQTNQNRTSLKGRYGRFVQSADNSDESDDSSSEEIAVPIEESTYSNYIENGQNDNQNFDNGFESRPSGRTSNNEGEEYVYHGESGTGNGIDTGENSQRQSGSGSSTWTGNGSDRDGLEHWNQNMQNNQGLNYEKRSPNHQQSQQGIHRGQGSQLRGRGQNGQHRYRSWADYQRHQQQNNLGEEYEPEDVTPTINSIGGQGHSNAQNHGKTGEYEADGRLPQGRARTPSMGTDYEPVEVEDRTTPSGVSNAKTMTTEHEIEAEDLTTKSPGGSVTSGRVTVLGHSTGEYEMEDRTTTAAPKVNKATVDTWESGMATKTNKPHQTGQGSRTTDAKLPGSWVNIGQKPYRNNATDKNGWTIYASSVDGSGQGNGIKPRQSWFNGSPDRKHTQNQGQAKSDSGTGPENKRKAFPGTRPRPVENGDINTVIRTDIGRIPNENVQRNAWLDTTPINNQPKAVLDNKQQQRQEPSIRPSFHGGRSPSWVRTATPTGRSPSVIRQNLYNRVGIPGSTSGPESAPMKHSDPTSANAASTSGWIKQPVRPAPPSGQNQEQPVHEPLRTNSSPQYPNDNWVDPPEIQTQKPWQPSHRTNQNQNQNKWQNNQRNKETWSSGLARLNDNTPDRRGAQMDPWNGRTSNQPPYKQPRRVNMKPGNNVHRPVEPRWRGPSGSSTLNNVDPKVPDQLPQRASDATPSGKGQSHPPVRSSKQPIRSNKLPNQKPTGSFPYQGEQPVFKDINSASLPQPAGRGRQVYPNEHNTRQRPMDSEYVTEKPVVDGTRVSKRPTRTDTDHVTVAMKLDVSDATVPNLKTNDWGNSLHRGDFIYKPKPTKVPQGSRATQRVSNPDVSRAIPNKARSRSVETSTFLVINPNSKTSHTGPAVIRPSNNNEHPWRQDNNIQPVGKQVTGNNEHLNKIKSLLDQQHPSTVIKHFIEMTTENSLGVAGNRGNSGLITNIDNTLSSDNPQVINLLRDIERANRQGQGQHVKGVPKNDVIARMSSTSVLGKNPNTIDMAPGHGSIVDGVDAEVLLNSNANIHGIINIRDPGTAKSPSVNSLLGNTKLENTKNRTPYPRFHASGRANDIHFGAHRMEIKSVNGEARPVEEIESSTQEYVKVPKGSKGNKIVNQSASKTENNGLNIAGNKNIVQSQVGTDKASTSTTSNSWSEYSPNPPHKDANTKRTTQPTFLEAAGNRAGLNKGEGEQQTASDTAGPQSGAQIQQKALRRTQGPNPGGFGASWMEGMGGTGAWKAAARKEARELVLEKEGHWRSVNITTIGRKSDMCPVYDVTYQENAVILSTGHNSCKIVITWHQRPKSRPFQQQTPFGMTNHFVTRMRYVPVVTYVNAR